MWLDIARRTIAVIILKVTGIFVGGSVIGLEVMQAVAMAVGLVLALREPP